MSDYIISKDTESMLYFDDENDITKNSISSSTTEYKNTGILSLSNNKRRSKPSSLLIEPGDSIYRNLHLFTTHKYDWLADNAYTADFWFYIETKDDSVKIDNPYFFELTTGDGKIEMPGYKEPSGKAMIAGPVGYYKRPEDDDKHTTGSLYPIILRISVNSIKDDDQHYNITANWFYRRISKMQGSTAYQVINHSNKKEFFKIDKTFLNKWHHFAIIVKAGSAMIYLDGVPKISLTYNNKATETVDKSKACFIEGPWAYLSIGNQTDFLLSNQETLDNTKASFYIDNFRLTKKALWNGELFIPPGSPGRILVKQNNRVYGYDISDYTFKQLAIDWDKRTIEEKRKVIGNLYTENLDIDDMKKVLNPEEDFSIETYSDTYGIRCEIIDKSMDELVSPKKLITISDRELEDTEYRPSSLYFDTNIDGNSYCKILFTHDLKTYYRYDKESKKFVEISIDKIQDEGNDIGRYTDKEVIDFLRTGFAIAYYMHLEPVSSNLSINSVSINIDYSAIWMHSTKKNSKYEYKLPNLLEITLLSDGDYKINYQDYR